ncbi:hypothetical protein [Terriglobus sp.]|uniref:hypothetical protein n=1 Tax=Terriglobus sp. TaxID=1889013 RepID=UPI003B00CBD6
MPSRSPRNEDEQTTVNRYSTERRRQLLVLLIFAAAILLISVLIAGIHNVFLPGWWRIDLP